MTKRRTSTFCIVTSARTRDELRQGLQMKLKVLDWGRGTAEDENAYWFEVTRRSPTDSVPGLDELSAALTSEDCIRRVMPQVEEGTGKDLARQLPLLSSERVNGLWTSGVQGGVQKPKAEPESRRDSSSEQMPLFG